MQSRLTLILLFTFANSLAQRNKEDPLQKIRDGITKESEGTPRSGYKMESGLLMEPYRGQNIGGSSQTGRIGGSSQTGGVPGGSLPRGGQRSGEDDQGRSQYFTRTDCQISEPVFLLLLVFK